MNRNLKFKHMNICANLASKANRDDMQLSSVMGDFFGMKEAATYMHKSKSAMQKISSKRLIPKYRPNNGKVLFKKSDLDNFVKASRMSSCFELEKEAVTNLLNADFSEEKC